MALLCWNCTEVRLQFLNVVNGGSRLTFLANIGISFDGTTSGLILPKVSRFTSPLLNSKT